MKICHLLSMLMLGISAVACAQVPLTPAPKHELTVPNLDEDSAACVVKVPLLNPPCTPKGCTLPALAGATLESIRLNFSCLPVSAPTGFENPAPEVKVQTFLVKNTWIHLSLADGVFEPPNERFRELHFCVYGKQFNNFCGYAKVMRLGDPPRVDGTRTVKAFLEEIEFQGAVPALVK